jgi:hypothetical protein
VERSLDTDTYRAQADRLAADPNTRAAAVALRDLVEELELERRRRRLAQRRLAATARNGRGGT